MELRVKVSKADWGGRDQSPWVKDTVMTKAASGDFRCETRASKASGINGAQAGGGQQN